MFGPRKISNTPGGPMDAASAWMQFAISYRQMCMSASEVIVRRSLRMSQGNMSAPEALGMMMEKATAFVQASERAAVAAAGGADPLRIASAALHPIRAKTRSNVRKLRR
jgi:hypothetical protein